MNPTEVHRPLCTIELIAEGHAERCPGADCAFWDRGCVLARVESELDGRPEVAQLLLDLRRELEAGRAIELEEAHSRFAHILNEGEGIAESARREQVPGSSQAPASIGATGRLRYETAASRRA